MDTATFKNKFNVILTNLGGSATVTFAIAVENAYEAYAVAKAIEEYANLRGGVSNITPPTANKLFNQSPGMLWVAKCYIVTFKNGEEFYFTADVEVYGLPAIPGSPAGDKFEVDVLVVKGSHILDILGRYGGYPAPQHIDCVFECKYGKKKKGQLRELLGLRRHLTLLSPLNQPHNHVFGIQVANSHHPIPIVMVRPTYAPFFDRATMNYYDLHQEVLV